GRHGRPGQLDHQVQARLTAPPPAPWDENPAESVGHPGGNRYLGCTDGLAGPTQRGVTSGGTAMVTTRRRLLAGTGTSAIGAVLAGGLTGCGADSGSAAGELRFTWWGNDVRNRLTDEAIQAYLASHEGVTITPEPGEWSSYWEKLGTQVAAGDEPDIIQMDEKYIREYGDRGALLDLAEYGVDTSKFAEGTAEPGIIDGK